MHSAFSIIFFTADLILVSIVMTRTVSPDHQSTKAGGEDERKMKKGEKLAAVKMLPKQNELIVLKCLHDCNFLCLLRFSISFCDVHFSMHLSIWILFGCFL